MQYAESTPEEVGATTVERKRKDYMDLKHIFRYHTPGQEQLPRYEALRNAALVFAEAIVENTPEGADQTAAIRKVREAVMTANASIALGGKL